MALAKLKLNLGTSTPADVEELTALWQYCFLEDKTGPFVSWYFANRFSPETTYLAKAADGNSAGTIAGAVYAPPVTMQVRGKSLTLPYIQGVAIAPGFRGQGVANQVLNYCLNDLWAKKVPLGVLKPFDPGFYGKTGWANFAYLLKYKLPLSELTNQRPSGELEFVYTSQGTAFVKEMQEVYESWLQAVPNRAIRNQADFLRLLADHQQDGGEIILATRAGKPVGYLLYHLSPTCFFIREAAYTEPLALSSLLALAKAHDSQTKNCLIAAPNLEASRLLLPDTLAGANLYPFAMARIINLETALEGLPGGELLTEPVYLQIMDAEIFGNSGLYRLEQGKAGLHIEKINNLTAKLPKNTLTFDILTLTKILMGCYNYNIISKYDTTCEKTKNNPPAESWVEPAMANIFSKVESYFYEYF